MKEYDKEKRKIWKDRYEKTDMKRQTDRQTDRKKERKKERSFLKKDRRQKRR